MANDYMIEPGSHAKLGKSLDPGTVNVFIGGNWQDTHVLSVDSTPDEFRNFAASLFRTPELQNGLLLQLRGLVVSSVSSAPARELAQKVLAGYCEALDLDPDYLPPLPWDRPVLESLLPHRGEKLMLDQVVEIVPGLSAHGYYRVTDEVCEGHFRVWRGTDRVEALQLLGAIALLVDPRYRGLLAMAHEIEGPIRFPRSAVAGDIIDLSVEFTGEGKTKAGLIFSPKGDGMARLAKGVACSVKGIDCILAPVQ